MKKNTEKQKQFDAILLDLLSSGLGATIILMLIFSLNLSGVFSTVKNSSYEPPLPNIGDASLVSKDAQKTKSMGSMRFVAIEGFGKEKVAKLKKEVLKLDSLWTNSIDNEESYDKSVLNNLNKSYQIEINENSTTFYFFIDHVLGVIEFKIPTSINLAGCVVTTGIIEGTSTVPSEKFLNGIYGRKEKAFGEDKNGLSVKFNTGNLRNKNLINIY